MWGAHIGKTGTDNGVWAVREGLEEGKGEILCYVKVSVSLDRTPVFNTRDVTNYTQLEKVIFDAFDPSSDWLAAAKKPGVYPRGSFIQEVYQEAERQGARAIVMEIGRQWPECPEGLESHYFAMGRPTGGSLYTLPGATPDAVHKIRRAWGLRR